MLVLFAQVHMFSLRTCQIQAHLLLLLETEADNQNLKANCRVIQGRSEHTNTAIQY